LLGNSEDRTFERKRLKVGQSPDARERFLCLIYLISLFIYFTNRRKYISIEFKIISVLSHFERYY
jgi:hypothetical protein